MALNHPHGRLALRKYWYQNQTNGVKIRPTLLNRPGYMNEELRHAGNVVRDPSSLLSWFGLAWVMLLSTLGGVVRVLREVKLNGKSVKKILTIFLIEVVISNFAGLLTWFLCMSRGMEQFDTALLTSLAAYMGPRALNVIEQIWRAAITSNPTPPTE